MDLWGMLGISPQTGLLAVAAGVVTAFLVAASLLHRRSRRPKHRLDLDDHR